MFSEHTLQQELACIARIAHLALTNYAAPYQGSLQLLCHSENATYAITTPGGQRYVLRVHRPDYHRRAAIASELAWLAALQQADIEVPTPIAGCDGELIQTAGDAQSGTRFVVLFHWIDGHEPDPQQALGPAFQRLGTINARLHRQARDWQRPAGFERMTWNHASMLGEHGHWGRWQAAPYLDAAATALVDETVSLIGQRMADYGEGPARFGLIHADLRLANLLEHHGVTRAIDFDDCGFGWYLHDLAAALSFHEHHADVPMWLDNWLLGYERVARLERDDLLILPTLIMQRRLQLLAWFGSHRGTPTAEGLGREWVESTLQLCQRYLRGKPVGVVIAD